MLEVAGLPETHPALEKVSRKTSKNESGVMINVGPCSFCNALLTYQLYTGLAPPLITAEVNATSVPAHTGLTEADIETLTGRTGFVVKGSVLDAAVGAVQHPPGVVQHTQNN